jgi:L-threonylcarbamoyladenylate synthase
LRNDLGMPVLPPTPDNITAAARYLAQGGLVAFPTETVYGLGADATNAFAVAALYAAKGRPSFNPLIIHVPGAELAWRFGVPTEAARALAAAFWPGPLTLVLTKQPNSGLAYLATAGLDTVAIRVPAHRIALQLIGQAGRPIAAPSANKSGRVSPTMASHVAADFGNELSIIIDGGATEVGVESTIVDVTGARAVLLRPGGVPRAEIERVLGVPLMDAAIDPHAPTAPGQLASHYAPRAAVRLNAHEVHAGEALMAFGAPLAHAGQMANLSLRGDLLEAAANLFSMLRALDASGAHAIAVMPIPQAGLGEAINDRLQRAAAPRDTVAQVGQAGMGP